MSRYTKTGTILDKILAHKVIEVERSQRRRPLAMIAHLARMMPPPKDVISALRQSTVALIAEVKHASPSRGILIEPFEPITLAQTYAKNGAAMISVLTDEAFFQGHLDHLRNIRAHVDIPLLRKDFIIEPYQVYEAREVGADAVLLIAAALDDGPLSDLYDLIVHLGMTPLIEVHNQDELERALQLNPELIGINNRDLRTFNVDIALTATLAQQIPNHITLVAESGMKTTADIQNMGQAGAHAVLIGEGIVTAKHIAETVQAFSNVERVT